MKLRAKTILTIDGRVFLPGDEFELKDLQYALILLKHEWVEEVVEETQNVRKKGGKNESKSE